MNHTLHVVALPHTQATSSFNHCAYTAKARKFASMMAARGHKVFLYAGDEFEGHHDVELVPCITRAEQEEILGDEPWYRDGEIYSVDWDHSQPIWQVFINRAISKIQYRAEQRDFICLSTGVPYQQIANHFSDRIVVEYGIGYEGILPETKHVFESYAWMHTVEGARQGAQAADGKFYDAVIPNFFEVKDFPAQQTESYFTDLGPYCLFMSRMTPRKGYEIAVEATRRAGLDLVIAGVGGDAVEADHVRHVGLANARVRGQLMAGARATFMPTLYLEPFGGVAVESMLCGTPVISTDFGAFPELIEHGVDGFRCHTMAEFTNAIFDVVGLNRKKIRTRARSRFRTDTVGAQYEAYFDRLYGIWGEGFYA